MAQVANAVPALNKMFNSISLLALKGTGFQNNQDVTVTNAGSTKIWTGKLKHVTGGGTSGVAKLKCDLGVSSDKDFEPEENENVAVTVDNSKATNIDVDLYAE